MNRVVAAVDHLPMLGMQEVDVVQLAEVVHDGLPVASVVYRLILSNRHVAEAIGRKHFRKRAQIFLERRWVLGHADEHEAIPHGAMDGAQRALGTGEACELFPVRNSGEPAVCGVGPGVIATAEAVGVAPLLSDETIAPVLTDVVEGPDDGVGTTGDQNLLSTEFKDEIVAGSFEVALEAGQEPATVQTRCHSRSIQSVLT